MPPIPTTFVVSALLRRDDRLLLVEPGEAPAGATYEADRT